MRITILNTHLYNLLNSVYVFVESRLCKEEAPLTLIISLPAPSWGRMRKPSQCSGNMRPKGREKKTFWSVSWQQDDPVPLNEQSRGWRGVSHWVGKHGLTRMFPCGRAALWVPGRSLRSNEGSLGSRGKNYNWWTDRGQETIWQLCGEVV